MPQPIQNFRSTLPPELDYYFTDLSKHLLYPGVSDRSLTGPQPIRPIPETNLRPKDYAQTPSNFARTALYPGVSSDALKTYKPQWFSK